MAFNHSRSVGEEEEVEVVETYQIRFLYLPFVFLLFSFLFFVCTFLCFPLIIARSLLLFWPDTGAPFTGFLLLRLAPTAKEGPKTGVMDFLVVRSSPRQGLSVA